MITVSVERLSDRQFKEQIELSVLDDMLRVPSPTEKPVEETREHRIIKAYYTTLALTDDEVLALRAAREAAYERS